MCSLLPGRLCSRVAGFSCALPCVCSSWFWGKIWSDFAGWQHETKTDLERLLSFLHSRRFADVRNQYFEPQGACIKLLKQRQEHGKNTCYSPHGRAINKTYRSTHNYNYLWTQISQQCTNFYQFQCETKTNILHFEPPQPTTYWTFTSRLDTPYHVSTWS